MGKRKPWPPSFQSDRLSWKDMRHIAKAALANAVEPEPEYHTGKHWVD